MSSISGDFSTGLLGHWSLEEASGTRVDELGANNFADFNTVGQGTGIQGNCADFELSNTEYLAIASPSSDFKGLGDFTLNFWFNLESALSVGQRMALFWRSDTIQTELENVAGTYRVRCFIRDSVGFEAAHQNFSVNPSTSTWYMITVVRDQSAGTTQIYSNATSLGTFTGRTNVLRSDNQPTWLGGVATLYTFDGLIDELSFWTTPLTSGDISTIYNSGAGIPYTAAAAPRRIFNIS